MESPFEQAQQFTGLWVDYMTRMLQTSMAFDVNGMNGGKTPPDIAREMRSVALGTMARYTEQFMRSPQFLETMKQSLDVAIGFRKQMNDLLTGMQHNAQGVARQDIDSLMLTVRHIETRLLDSMSQIAAQLDAISQRLETLEQAKPPHNGESPAPQQTRLDTEQQQPT